MKQIVLILLTWALRKLTGASRQLWQDLESRVRMADVGKGVGGRPLTAEEKHAEVDIWLSGMEPLSRMPMLRQYLIQSAVLTLRLRTYWATKLPF